MKSFNPVSFYNQVRDELKKVNWPTKETTISTSIVVVVVVGLITAYLGIVDAIVSRLAGQIIGSFYGKTMVCTSHIFWL